jgi:hypothetical protein
MYLSLPNQEPVRQKNLFRTTASAFVALAVVCLTGGCSAQADPSAPETVLPGDKRFDTPAFTDYEATYKSAGGKAGTFTLQARKSNNGKKLSLIDIIPMKENVIVSQRVIDLKSHRFEFSAGPFFPWGPEFVVAQTSTTNYDWARIPIGGGEPKRATGEVANTGYISEMFSPTLSALMPMAVGTRFRLPEAIPIVDETVRSDLIEYEVIGRENLELADGLSCDCWVIEKRNGNGTIERIWVARKAPFVFRRHRDGGGKRDFVSDLLSFRPLN